ncbi:MAG: hypothetical protein Q9183_006621 [Haloplaca sp. 2 TL-2023]
MHQGQVPGPPNPPESAFNNSRGAGGPTGRPFIPPTEHMSPRQNATSLDDLVSSAARDADRAAASTKSAPKVEEAAEDKKAKKKEDKAMKLVYSDNEVSPEEKMAHLPRYAFAPEGKVAA